MGDLGYCGGDRGEVEEDPGADAAGQNFDAEKELGAKCGADGESDVVDAAGEGQCGDAGILAGGCELVAGSVTEI